MEKIRFLKTEQQTYNASLYFVSKNVLRIDFSEDTEQLPSEGDFANGLEILNEHNDFVQATYDDFVTVYRTYEDNEYRVELSNDESVYVESEATEYPKYDDTLYVPTLENIISNKVNTLSNLCNKAIINGVDIEIGDTVEHFSYTDEDQVNIKEIFDLAMQTQTPMYYHADGQSCKLYTVEQIANIYATLALNKMHNITYFNQLKLYVQSLDEIEDVKAVEYGQNLEGEYLEVYNAAMAQAKTGMNALFGVTE